MSEIFFNVDGKTHHLRILPVDSKPPDVTVWEAMVDGSSYTYFEGHHDIEVWQLIELAVQSFLEYRMDDRLIKTRWIP